jgi:hypothetical protein
MMYWQKVLWGALSSNVISHGQHADFLYELVAVSTSGSAESPSSSSERGAEASE